MRKVYSIYIMTQLYVELGVLPELYTNEEGSIVGQYEESEALEKAIRSYYAGESMVEIKGWIEAYKLVKGLVFKSKDGAKR